MNDNTTLREIKQNLRHNRKILNDILEAGLGIGLEELILLLIALLKGANQYGNQSSGQQEERQGPGN